MNAGIAALDPDQFADEAPGMLEEWNKSKKAVKTAARVHEKEFEDA